MPPGWKCERVKHLDNIKNLLDQGFQLLGMFDNRKELWSEICAYLDFPKCIEYFNWDWDSKVIVFPRDLKSLAGDWCMYKNNLYKLFFLYNKRPFATGTNVANLTEWILKACWERLRAGSHHELIVCPYELIGTECDDTYKIKFTKELSSTEFEEFKVGWNRALEYEIWTVTDLILESTEQYEKNNPDVSFLDKANAISFVGHVMGRVEMFLGEVDTTLPLFPTSISIKPLIRLFSVDGSQFVMAHELLGTLKKHEMKVERKFEKEVNGMLKLSTLSFEKIEQKVGEDVFKNLDFVEMKMHSLTFSHTPIPTHDGGFCLFAADALHEILMDLILVKKVFQNIQKENQIHVMQFLESLQLYFDAKRGIHFIEMEVVDAIKTLWKTAYDETIQPIASKTEYIDPTIRYNPEVTELEDAIKKLKLDGFLDDIMTYTRKIIEERNPNEPRNLYKSLAKCQINSIIRKIPGIPEFIHNQKACKRMNIVGCKLCQKEVEEVAENEEK